MLKAATLFELWHDAVHRAARDVDLLGFGEPAVERMQAVFRELCTVDVEPDGLGFLERSARAEPIRDGQAYGGVEKQAQWSAFSRRVELSPAVSLESITEVLRRFLLPPTGAAARGEPFERDWPAGGDWRLG